ncbi:PREDICTED: uncharacterized protein LOC108368229 [Rhagoletis zephyria]|uniref:uncharacterized protein LOC108368229 n=1 Tax=Rhagoletis zephyria TaxID=28612 RepID=UPI0008117B8A|nr:PREDICTED: uncharacterized protein LOC108368229 [Rhagoletis zephyria]
MDVSRQTYSEANTTGVSMYLSFDSSISSAAYKTLEATTDNLSILSNMDHEEETVENSQELNQNSTLEAIDSHLNYLASVKDMDTHSQLSAIPKRVLQEFNIASSTPTKEQLLRSVEVNRGSSADRCFDMKLAFMDMEEKIENDHVKNKENTLPLNEVALLSVKSNEEIPTLPKEEKVQILEVSTLKSDAESEKTECETSKTTEMANTEDDETPKNTDDQTIKAAVESKVQVADFNKRQSMAKKSLCEPNLLTNRPSRIVTNAARTNLAKEINSEIPKLLNKVLKFTEPTTVINDKPKTSSVLDKRKSISCNSKGRSSILPTTAKSLPEKRPFAFTHRMSVLVKTTLNSPARKIARRSVLPTGQQNWKNVAPTVSLKTSRKSMLPVGKSTQSTNSVTSSQSLSKPPSDSLKSIPSNRKSIFPIDKPRSESYKTTIASTLTTLNAKPRPSLARKAETSFVCNVCGSKYYIKSLLDAHKRSHEGDELPAFVKKTTSNVSNTAPVNSQANGVNKCKYCDKKFALLRALHIHLLQNCPKIPPNEKRKLNFHEMDHIGKAQLPEFFHANSSNGKINSQTQMTSSISAPTQRSHSDLSSISVSSTDSANDKKALAEITMIANTAAAAVDGLLSEMAPPSARMVKKTNAHAGVHRTPNKSIICHQCKLSFKCIMDLFQHNKTVHFNNASNQQGTENSAKKMTNNAIANDSK